MCYIMRMTKTVTLRDANQQFARNGTPVARLVPIGGRRVLTEKQQAALELLREAMREGLPIGAGKLDRDALHER